MKYLSDDGNSGMRFPPSVCVADISLTGCEVRKQVRPSHVQPYPHWSGGDLRNVLGLFKKPVDRWDKSE